MKKRQWKLQRQFVTHPNAHYRWDRVYQNLLRWTRRPALEQASKPVAQARLTQEG